MVKRSSGRIFAGVTGGATNERLARLTIRESETLGEWMPANGVRWQKPLRGTLHLTRSNLFMLGGGKAMMNAYYDTAVKLGVEIAYETEVRELKMIDGRICLRRGESQRLVEGIRGEGPRRRRPAALKRTFPG